MGARLNTEIGYGMEPEEFRNMLPANLREFLPADYHGIMTPYARLSFGAAGSHACQTGARWDMAPETTLSLEANLGTAPVSQASANSIMLRAVTSW